MSIDPGIIKTLYSLADDPLAYVMAVYPWGKKGTPLEKFAGPRRWQRRALQQLGDHIREDNLRVARGLEPRVFKLAISSGHGIGKSTFISMTAQWFQDCHPGTTGMLTANSETQLKYKLWAEFGRWHVLNLSAPLFENGAVHRVPVTDYKNAIEKELQIGTAHYKMGWNLWSMNNPAAFAGAHSQQGMMLAMDEADGIPKEIWDESLGAFTDPSPVRIWIVCSNPRKTTGPFADCFKPDSGWYTTNIDSRTVEGLDYEFLQSIIDRYGEESYEACTRVRGILPPHSENQLIERWEVDEAAARQLTEDTGAPLIMGVDPGGGSDPTVIRWRQGRDAASIPPVESVERDTTKTIALIAKWIDKTKPDAVFMDRGGLGQPLIDQLKASRYKIREVNFAGTPNRDIYANIRAEIWHLLKYWLADGKIDDHRQLKLDLTAPKRVDRESNDKYLLESKKDMRERGVPSPNHGDALALTFAGPVARRDQNANRPRREHMAQMDYPIFRR